MFACQGLDHFDFFQAERFFKFIRIGGDRRRRIRFPESRAARNPLRFLRPGNVQHGGKKIYPEEATNPAKHCLLIGEKILEADCQDFLRVFSCKSFGGVVGLDPGYRIQERVKIVNNRPSHAIDLRARIAHHI